MKLELKQAIPIAEAFVRLLHPFAEVVIHDLKKDQIAAIYNPFSKRKVGDRSYLQRYDFMISSKENVIGPYEKTNYDGRKLKSISIVLRNHKKTPQGFLCVNMDTSVFESCQNALALFLKHDTKNLSQETQKLFKDDLYEQINLFVQDYCKQKRLSIEVLSREDKQLIVHKLKKSGAFHGKNATSYIARILSVSRATIYNYVNDNHV